MSDNLTETHADHPIYWVTNPDTDGLAKLREPFPRSAINQLPRVTCKDCSDRKKECQEHRKRKCNVCGAYVSTAHIHLDFVGHAALTDRLLNVDPTWKWEPCATDQAGAPLLDHDSQGKPVGLWIKLTVCGVTRYGYGSCESGKPDAVKELIGDALRNAAMRFGCALDLWHKGDLPSTEDEGERTTNADPAPSQQDAQVADINAPSPKQIGLIKALSNKHNIADPQYRVILKAKWGVESSKQLSKAQASELIDALNDDAKRQAAVAFADNELRGAS